MYLSNSVFLSFSLIFLSLSPCISIFLIQFLHLFHSVFLSFSLIFSIFLAQFLYRSQSVHPVSSLSCSLGFSIFFTLFLYLSHPVSLSFSLCFSIFNNLYLQFYPEIYLANFIQRFILIILSRGLSC